MKPLPVEYHEFNSAGNYAGNWDVLRDVLIRMIADGDLRGADFCQIGQLAVRRDCGLITGQYYDKELFLATIDAVNDWIDSHPQHGSEAA
ncbi:MAG: hypothetical protein CMN85_10460 [Spongiibacteraceae bacterium]|nr:hypothetical protein [Spongiibacteraceae bacterium]|tara:strand:+ start:708 stop:977 length:270 start_codon:yes stop_codon:yes gene_type:complete